VQLEPVDLSVKAPVVLQVPRYSPQLPTNGLTYPGKVFPWNYDGFQNISWKRTRLRVVFLPFWQAVEPVRCADV
jgi:hypothetical protein